MFCWKDELGQYFLKNTAELIEDSNPISIILATEVGNPKVCCYKVIIHFKQLPIQDSLTVLI